MKMRLKWIALGAAPLAGAGFIAWKLDERPPYRFMEDSQFYFTYLHPPEGSAVSYSFSVPYEQMVNLARKELGHETGEVLSPDGDTVRLWKDAKGRGVVISTTHQGHEWPRMPAMPGGTTGFVTILREPTPMDRLRSWVYGLRYNASPIVNPGQKL